MGRIFVKYISAENGQLLEKQLNEYSSNVNAYFIDIEYHITENIYESFVTLSVSVRTWGSWVMDGDDEWTDGWWWLTEWMDGW